MLGRRRGRCYLALVFLPFLAQQLLQHSDAFIHVLFLQQKRRQEAQDCVLGHIEEHALRETLLDQRTRGNIEHEALNEPAAPRFTGGCVLADQLLELQMQIAADLSDVFEQVLFFDDSQVFEGDAACQRTAAESSAVLSG
jgi:hypothetical protein